MARSSPKLVWALALAASGCVKTTTSLNQLAPFVEEAVVRDEGRTIEGIAAIRQWMADAKAKYQHRVEPMETTERDGKAIVQGEVSGNFPNSPINLEHIFGLEGAKIASLEIR